MVTRTVVVLPGDVVLLDVVAQIVAAGLPALVMRFPEEFPVGGKTFLQPHFAHGDGCHQVSVPLMRKLMRHN